MTDKQIIIDEIEINPNDWLEPYKPIPACEIKDCEHWVYAGNDIYGCRIAEDGLVCDDFNNDDECCMYRQLEYYKEALKAKEQECEEKSWEIGNLGYKIKNQRKEINIRLEQLYRLKTENDECIKDNEYLKTIIKDFTQEVVKLKQTLTEIKEIVTNFYKTGFLRTDDDCILINNHLCVETLDKILQKISEVEDET